MENLFDIIIVGGGPAGLSCAIYALRANKKVLLLEDSIGGQMAIINKIENYPGFKEINGFELGAYMHAQVKTLGCEIKNETVLSYSLLGDIKVVNTAKNSFKSKAVVLCMGANTKKLEIDGESKFLGMGVSYCATCDGNFFRNKTVAIVGGGNTAMHDALYLSKICKKIYLIHRRDTFKAEEYVVSSVKNIENVEFVVNSHIEKISGNGFVEEILVKDNQNSEKLLKVDGVFIAIGRTPNTAFLQDVELDKDGYIITDEHMQTNIKCVFAAGDIRNTPLRQIVCAVSDGAIAATYVIKDI